MSDNIGTSDRGSSLAAPSHRGLGASDDAVGEALSELLSLEEDRRARKAAAERRRRAEEEQQRKEEEERRQIAEDERAALASALTSARAELDHTKSRLETASLDLERAKMENGSLRNALSSAQEAEAEARLVTGEGGASARRGKVPGWFLALNALLIVAGVGSFVLSSSQNRLDLARADLSHQSEVRQLRQDLSKARVASSQILAEATARAEREEARASSAEREVERLRAELDRATARPAHPRRRPAGVRPRPSTPARPDRPDPPTEAPRIPDDPLGGLFDL